jgi:hypothetical protein
MSDQIMETWAASGAVVVAGETVGAGFSGTMAAVHL